MSGRRLSNIFLHRVRLFIAEARNRSSKVCMSRQKAKGQALLDETLRYAFRSLLR